MLFILTVLDRWAAGGSAFASLQISTQSTATGCLDILATRHVFPCLSPPFSGSWAELGCSPTPDEVAKGNHERIRGLTQTFTAYLRLKSKHSELQRIPNSHTQRRGRGRRKERGSRRGKGEYVSSSCMLV